MIACAPSLDDALNDRSRAFFADVVAGLDALGVPHRRNPRLVRGLDYYGHTTFEFVTDALGAQGTVLAGGRYDGLVEQMGGPATPGTGWAAGVERLTMLVADTIEAPARPIAMIPLGREQTAAALRIAGRLRDAGHIVEFGFGTSMAKQMKWANRIGARLAIIVGSDELAREVATVRDMDAGAQEEVTLTGLEDRLARSA